jgi:hypothetical protein
VPSLDLRFADNKSLTDAVTGQSLVTFTRASSGTYVGSDGVLRTATTNLLLRSQELATSPWFNAGVTIANNSTDVLDPVGGSTSTKIVATGTGSAVGQGATISSVSTGSIWLRTSTGTANFSLIIYLSSSPFTNIGTANITVTTTWQRFSVTSSAPASAASYNFQLQAIPATTLYAWGAQLEQSSTVGEYIPTTSTINSAPRFDHNPTTGESLGLLVEEQRTNSIRNNTMVGAVAGTPGTLPTNWAIGNAGTLSTSIIGTGTESGITYVDLQISGTSSTGGPRIRFEALDSITAASGQTWTGSVYVRQVGGSTTNITSLTADVFTRDTAQTTEVETFAGSNITSLGVSSIIRSRSTVSGTLANASSTRVCSRLTLNCSSGVAIDITLRIGLPQLEQGAFATSVIPTATATVTRSADVASITGTNFSSWYRQDEGTVFASTSNAGTGASFMFSIHDGTQNNRITQFRTTSAVGSRHVVAGVASNPGDVFFSGGASAQVRSALFVSSSSSVGCANGVLSTASSAGSMPVVTTLGIAMAPASDFQLNGTIRRLTYWPRRLGNEVLQEVTR